MIETAAGVLAAPEIAREARGADRRHQRPSPPTCGLPPDAARAPLQMALQSIVLAARAAGIAVFDGVFNGLDDPDGFVAEAEEGRRLGFDGKSLIHPSQIEPCHARFRAERSGNRPRRAAGRGATAAPSGSRTR